MKKTYINILIVLIVKLLLSGGGDINAQTTFTVGASGTYTTIAAAYAACTGSPPGYIIEIKSDYTTEALPITLGAKANLNAGNTVTIRPQATMTISGSATRIFNFSAAHHVIIDGRINSAGSGVLTIDNTTTNVSEYAIRFENDASNNTVKYCTVKGRSTTGIIIFVTTTGTTGNDNNIIDNCTITRSAAGNTNWGIRSIGTAAKENNNNTISNCNFADIIRPIYIESNSYDFTITGNSFYLAAAVTPADYYYGIYCSATLGGHTISSNYFGGRSAQCGGAAYTLNSSAYSYTGIYFTSAVTGNAITINNNIFKNFSVTSTGEYVFIAMDLAGSANFNIGASAATGNAFGDTTSGTGSIVVSASTATPTYIFYGIKLTGTGTNTIKYNKFGSVTMSGTATGLNQNYMIGLRGSAGVTTVDNNTFGNVTANNINASGAGYYLGAFSSSSNSNCTFSNNLVQNFNASNTAALTTWEIPVVEFTGSGTYTVTGNTIGNSTNNNMTFATNAGVHPLYMGGTGTMISSNNIIQEFNCTNTGTFTYFHGICGASGVTTINNDTVRNIDVYGTYGSTALDLVGIRINAANAGQVISKSAAINLNHLTTATSVTVCGIYANNNNTTTVTKNHVSGLTLSNNTNSTSWYIGMYILPVAGTWQVSNNVILLDCGSNSPEASGMKYEGSGGTGNIYHNSIKIYGTATSGSGLSSALFNNQASGTVTFKNNILQNIRTGGTGTHYAFRVGVAGTATYDYNYLETVAAPIARYNAVNQSTITNWRTASGASANEITHGGTGISLEMIKGYCDNAQIVNKGSYYASVSDDKEAYVRNNPSPWIGAWENAPISLPIELTNFNTYCNAGKANLFWSTATETNNDYFTIEKSVGGNAFHEIGIVDSKAWGGSSISTLSYSFTDNILLKEESKYSNNIFYYRIKQTDFNGNYTYSYISSTNCDGYCIGDITVSGINGKNYINIPSACSTHLNIDIYNLLGQIILKKTVYLEEGDNHIQIEDNDIANGVYMLKTSIHNQTIIKKFLKQ
ncbi:MAG: T9SS type A sorting domain-containing protein [Bacteroidota bacterium]